ncbi:uncharacterized protein BO66DRAFT_198105 [Aspergillus aculeatinus CBS 121060]|uniref:Uncharacterized protein n=1 Tax=Aspergillus aculeatinus CBS 121060 TaxID=1448322 RepID=A0ACD1GWV0_9EURO|nr:hypothetical protein BO66DRAFT_198105 [Aspergillus aculeatinus CBS 121060]RAH65674.1 hypothetical protein BO66DRAFT_198105 [Aspergillus aculeatinus CBS 121060]
MLACSITLLMTPLRGGEGLLIPLREAIGELAKAAGWAVSWHLRHQGPRAAVTCKCVPSKAISVVCSSYFECYLRSSNSIQHKSSNFIKNLLQTSNRQLMLVNRSDYDQF